MKQDMLDLDVNISPHADTGSIHEGPVHLVQAVEMIKSRINRIRHMELVNHHSSQYRNRRWTGTDEELFQIKLRVLTKNPMIFQNFKERLGEAKERAHCKEGINQILHEYFDVYMRMPELRDEVSHLEHSTTPVAKKRLKVLVATYLGGGEPGSIDSVSLPTRMIHLTTKQPKSMPCLPLDDTIPARCISKSGTFDTVDDCADSSSTGSL